MRILLDENVPEALAENFVGHECSHVLRLGWVGITNGALLDRAEEAGFQMLLTFDKGIPAQQKMAGRKIAVFVLKPEGQGVLATRALLGEMVPALDNLREGEVKVFTNRKNG